MNKYILFILFILFALNLSAQRVIKFRTEDYSDAQESYANGKVSYQYYEDPKTGAYVRHGMCRYICTYNGFYKIVTGHFKNGNRDGIWTERITKKDMENRGGTFTTGHLQASFSYKNGYPDGLWQLNDVWKIRQKKYTFNGWYWGPFFSPEKRSFSLTFKKGRVVGKVSYYTLYKEHNTFFVNDNGYITGHFSKERPLCTTDYIVNNMGIVTQYTIRDHPGPDSYRFNIKPYTERLAEAYVRGKITKDSIINTGYHLIDSEKANEIFNDYGSMVDQDALLPDKYGGDKTVNSKDYYGKFTFIQDFDTIDYQYHPKWIAMGLKDSIYPISNEKTVKAVKAFLKLCSKHIPAKQVRELQDAIEQFEERQHQKEREAKAQLELDSLETAIIKDLKNFEKKGSEYDSYQFTLAEERTPYNRDNSIDTFNEIWNNFIYKITHNILGKFGNILSVWDNTQMSSTTNDIYSSLGIERNLSDDTYSRNIYDFNSIKSIFADYKDKKKKMLDSIPSSEDIGTLLSKIRILIKDKKIKRIRPVFFSIIDEFNRQMENKPKDTLFAKEYYDKATKIVQAINSTDDNCKQLVKQLKKEHSITDKINLLLRE